MDDLSEYLKICSKFGTPLEVRRFVCPHCFSSKLWFLYHLDPSHIISCDSCKEMFVLDREIRSFETYPQRSSLNRCFFALSPVSPNYPKK